MSSYTLFSEQLIVALGWTFVHSIWQIILIAGIITLVWAYHQHLSAQWKYSLVYTGLIAAGVVSIGTFIYYFSSDQSTSISKITTRSAGSEYLFLIENGLTQERTLVAWIDNYIHLISYLWLIGFCFFSIRFLGGLNQVIRIRKSAIPINNRHLEKKILQLAQKIRITRLVSIAQSSLIKGPMIVGYFKPIILLPIGLINQLSIEEIEAIIAHELAHLQRKDYLWNFLQMLIETVFYYHPGIWWLSSLARTEREHCCDDIALQLCDNSVTYAKTLVRLEENQLAISTRFAPSFLGQKRSLLNRIKRILNQPLNHSTDMEKIIAFFTAFTTIILLLIQWWSPTNPMPNEVSSSLSNPFHELLAKKDASPPASLKIELTNEKDTLPKKGEIHRFRYSNNDESIELKEHNGTILSLKINGKVIPEEEYAKYEEQIEALKENVPTAPRPPRAPRAPRAPKPPRALRAPRVAPTPPSPPSPPSPTNDIGMYEEEMEHFEEEMKRFEEEIEHFAEEMEHFGEEMEHSEEEMNLLNGNGFEQLSETMAELTASLRESFDVDTNEWEKIHNELEARADEIRARANEMEARASERYIERHKEELQRMKEQMKQNMEQSKSAIKNNLKQLEKELERQYGSVRHYSSPNINNVIVHELHKDGLIKDTNNYSFKLSNKKFKVNGKRMPDSVHQKYVQLYQDITGIELNKNSSFELSGKGNE